ncbi:Dipeptide transport ATP-binding protein dppD [Roseomonas mucosa]|uniref:Glutathione import ATP-binding protein GsiA n=1 Tax=Roseomonas mucosa TaxID=207340 RepID=A0A379N1X8_9PROT|nr:MULTISPECIES: ABC transporter ATP-binding protein [Roseomonas]MCG7353992.1 ABC transporter ATP-binding protein [Roseomonas mucosa]MCG7359112.1 ABC transporter ATP-binding protein [Roseomonas mucosa]MDT8289586.1 ABC transporter ATP-binding protein [Roseomonas mucosa]MDT8292868.1 ABC transporter ATP-binding protein [Roseomonas mucosa]MDT8313978.1 ABC transporter ATP-binding protein [Roseomonas mucosa]
MTAAGTLTPPASAAAPATGEGLRVRGLRVAMGPLPIVHGVDLAVAPGEILGLVGESGSGKSVSLRAIPGLLPPKARIAGEVLWNGRNLLALPPRALQQVRGREVAMIFQEPGLALNPVMTVGAQIDESLQAHFPRLGRAARRERAEQLLAEVGIPSPRERLGSYPHEFSGGMRQRAMIAIALAPGPRLLLADEPTTALDVTVQDGILRLLRRLVEEHRMAMILVTHDLGVVAETCDRVSVMYAGRVVESGPAAGLFAHPRHAYTAALLGAMPGEENEGGRLSPVPGTPPSPLRMPPGCAFAPRCTWRMAGCEAGVPALESVEPDHLAACLAADLLPPRWMEQER